LSEHTLDEIKGLGPATKTKLHGLNIHTVEALAFTTSRDLEEAGIKEAAPKLIQQAIEFLAERSFIPANELLEQRKSVTKLSTGSKQLDELFQGGYETQSITEYASPYGCGKTQLCLTAAVIAQQPKEQGGLNGGVLWIDSEETFRPERVYQIAEARGFDPEKVVKGLILAPAYNSEHQTLIAQRADEVMKQNKIRLIIVDCVSPETSILTPKGLVKISNLQSVVRSVEGDRTGTASMVDKASQGTALVEQEEMLRISTPFRDIVCSPNHRLFTVGTSNLNGRVLKEIHAKDVSIGSPLVTLQELAYEGKFWIGPNASELLGFVDGDGHIEKKRPIVSLDSSSRELLEHYQMVAQKLGLRTGHIYSYKQGRYWRLVLTKGQNLELFNTIRQNDFKRIVGATTEECKAYVRGFFDAEGCIHISKMHQGAKGTFRNATIDFSNKNLDMLNVIRDCLFRIGTPALKPKLYRNRLGECYRFFVTRSLYVKKLIETVGTNHPKKKTISSLILKYMNESKGRSSGKGSILAVEHVKRVEKVPSMLSCEITVPDTGRYVANGFLVHNSVMAHFRSEYLGRDQLPPRQGKLNQHLHQIMKLARAFNAVAIVTNQATANPTGNPYAPEWKATGGNIIAHTCNLRVLLRPAGKNTRIASVADSSWIEPGERVFKITAKGIEDVPEDEKKKSE
jgi:RecA/RadA recombinase